VSPAAPLADLLHDALPQTQCTRCSYPDCRAYAEAIARGEADINQCPPGGQEGIVRLARIAGRPVLPLSAAYGVEAPRHQAVIDEAWCIGCTLCLKACPVDCIVGGPKTMHTVIDHLCTGCDLCLPVCPVDCIDMVDVSGDKTGWSAWSKAQADTARQRFEFHQFRLARDKAEHEQRLAAKARQRQARTAAGARPELGGESDAKRATIGAALARARAQRKGPPR
jgi:electron transport complex protein RnfB